MSQPGLDSNYDLSLGPGNWLHGYCQQCIFKRKCRVTAGRSNCCHWISGYQTCQVLCQRLCYIIIMVAYTDRYNDNMSNICFLSKWVQQKYVSLCASPKNDYNSCWPKSRALVSTSPYLTNNVYIYLLDQCSDNPCLNVTRLSRMSP